MQQSICNLNFSQWWNGTDVSYKQYIDCFGKSDTVYGSLYVVRRLDQGLAKA